MKILFIFLGIFLLNTCSNEGELTLITKLPKKLTENSGIVSFNDSTAWFIEDSGNSDNIYKTDFQGNIIQQFDIKNEKNNDWEDLTKDHLNNTYIGDFGNNHNKRKNLVIYKLPNIEIEKGDKINVEKIEFSYPEQKDFPPKKEHQVFDAEAFFHAQGYLYIFTKNRAHPFTGETWIYRVPDQKGTYEAELLGTLFINNDWKTGQVTSADISPDGKTIVLLTNGKLYTFTNFTLENLTQATKTEIDLGVRTQLESVCFINATQLLLSDEERENTGRNLYSYQIR